MRAGELRVSEINLAARTTVKTAGSEIVNDANDGANLAVLADFELLPDGVAAWKLLVEQSFFVDENDLLGIGAVRGEVNNRP